MKRSHIERNARRHRWGRWLLAFVVVNLWACDTAYAKASPACRVWLAKVVHEPKPTPAKTASDKGLAAKMAMAGFAAPDPLDVASLTEADKLEAIQCLLGAENDLRPASFSGVTRLDVSQLFAPARANLAALYMISYIYSGRAGHAGAVALRGENASDRDVHHFYATKPEAVHKAYRAYRAWFAKVRRMGLAKARRAGLEPLEGTGLDWY